MTNEQILKLWNKKCLRQHLTPIALVCVDSDGFPHVLTQHDTVVLKKVWQHLAGAPIIDESTTLDGQEN